MAPPPVPLRKAEKPKQQSKRKSIGELDALLGEEIDAIERQQPRQPSPEKPAKKIKPVVKIPLAVPSAPVSAASTGAAPAISIPPVMLQVAGPNPPSDLPPTVQNTMPFRARRAKALVSTLSKDSHAILVSRPVVHR
jgi:transcription initiation factor TFIID subunit 2